MKIRENFTLQKIVHFILVYSKSAVGSTIFMDTTLSILVSPIHLSGYISWFADILVAIKLVGFLQSAKNPPTDAISPSLKVDGSGPLNNIVRSFLKSVITNLFSKVPFLTAMDPCLMTPLSLNLYPGMVLCNMKCLGVTL